MSTSSNMTATKALKDYIDSGAIKRLGEQISAAHPAFPLPAFIRSASRGLGKLEFTERTRHVAAVMADKLPRQRARALEILIDAMPPPLEDTEGMFSERYWLWPVSDYVRDYGAEQSTEGKYL